MRPMTYFLVKLKHYTKPTRMTKREIKNLMVQKDYICIDSLIYDAQENIVGSLVTKTVNQDYITKSEFSSLPLIEIMRRLGSLDPAKYDEVRSIGIKYRDDYDLEWM